MHAELGGEIADVVLWQYGGPWDAELAEAAAKEAAKLATKYRAHKYAFSRQESEEIHQVLPWVLQLRLAASSRCALQVFTKWDLDGDGKISFEELCEKMPGIDRDTLGRWQYKCDVDGDVSTSIVSALILS